MTLQENKLGNGIHRDMTYRELQSALKQWPEIKRTGKYCVLLARYQRAMKGKLLPDDCKQVKAKKAKAAKAVKAEKPVKAVSYRDAQRCIRYWAENVPAFECKLRRTGWNNLYQWARVLDSANVIARTDNTCGQEHEEMVGLLCQLINQAEEQ